MAQQIEPGLYRDVIEASFDDETLVAAVIDSQTREVLAYFDLSDWYKQTLSYWDTHSLPFSVKAKAYSIQADIKNRLWHLIESYQTTQRRK